MGAKLLMRMACALAILLPATICRPVGAFGQTTATDASGQTSAREAAIATQPESRFPAVLWPPVLTEPALRSSISLSPAVEMVKCKLGQSYTQLLTVTNHTVRELAFEMVAEDRASAEML